MNELEKLLGRLTIKFPTPLESGEVENKYFDHLSSHASCKIQYSLTIRGYKSTEQNERYASEIRGSIFRSTGDEMANLPFTMSRDRDDNFIDLKVTGVPGYDSIKEFKTLPSGNDQINLIDVLKAATEEYFSKRATRPTIRIPG